MRRTPKARTDDSPLDVRTAESDAKSRAKPGAKVRIEAIRFWCHKEGLTRCE